MSPLSASLPVALYPFRSLSLRLCPPFVLLVSLSLFLSGELCPCFTLSTLLFQHSSLVRFIYPFYALCCQSCTLFAPCPTASSSSCACVCTRIYMCVSCVYVCALSSSRCLPAWLDLFFIVVVFWVCSLCLSSLAISLLFASDYTCQHVNGVESLKISLTSCSDNKCFE